MNDPLASSGGSGTFRFLSQANSEGDLKRIIDRRNEAIIFPNNKCVFPTQIKVLNLPEREDRWKIFQEINKELFSEFNVSKFQASKSEDVVLSIFNSFIKCLEESFEKKETVIIMEDDGYVVPGGIEKLRFAFQDLPEDWDVLIGNHYFFGEMNLLTDNLAKPTGLASTLNFAVYRNTILPKIKENLHLRNEDRFDFDHFITHPLVPINNYTIWPMISREYVSFSDHKKSVVNMEYRVRENSHLYQYVDSDKYYSSLEGW
jgi:hypothetical protein